MAAAWFSSVIEQGKEEPPSITRGYALQKIGIPIIGAVGSAHLNSLSPPTQSVGRFETNLISQFCGSLKKLLGTPAIA